jgi:hypothetical protein
VTGAAGETAVFTRSTSGTCLKAGTVTGISVGDMVTCSTNQVRVMPGGDGTGDKGALIEGGATNLLIQSAALDNVAWGDSHDIAAIMTVTANAALAPDNTMTAERLQIPATTGTQYTQHYQLIDCGATATASVFVRGNGTSGTIDLCGAGECADCIYNSSTYTRCILAGSSNLRIAAAIGNVSLVAGVPRSAADVFATGFQCEAGKFATSYIPTTTVAVMRGADSLSFNVSIANAVISSGCAAATVLAPGFSRSGAVIMLDHTAGRPLYLASGAPKMGWWDGTNDTELAYGTLSQLIPKHFVSDWGGSSSRLRNITDSTSIDGGFTGTLSVGTGLFLGGGAPFTPGAELNGVIKDVQVDPVRTVCQ